jgi:hypothetical protein
LELFKIKEFRATCIKWNDYGGGKKGAIIRDGLKSGYELMGGGVCFVVWTFVNEWNPKDQNQCVSSTSWEAKRRVNEECLI